VRLVVMQQGVDLAVQALDLQRTRLARSEDSFGRVGPQLLEFVAETAGDFSIQVQARPGELGGTYEIKYLEVRAVTAKDRTRQAANRHVTAGNRFRSQASPESTRAMLVEYEKALTLFKQIDDKAGQATSLQYIGTYHEAQSDYRRAWENYSAALELWREVPDRRGEAYALSNIGTMQLYLGDLKLAYVAFEQAREIYREVRNREGEGLCYQEIGNIYRQQGDFTRALEYLQQGLTIFREVGAKGRLPYVMSNIGVAYLDLGNLKQAADYQNQALVITRELGHKSGTALALFNLGDVYAQQGETREALSFYQQALPLCLDAENRNCAGRTHRRLAGVFDSLGETQAALDHYAKGAAIYRERERPVELARMLNASGVLYSSLGDKTRARELHSEALTLARKAQSRQDEAASLANLADLHQDQGQTQKARESYHQALTISREIRNRQSEAENLSRLGLLTNSAGNKPEAIKYFEQALAISNELGARPNGAVTLNNLGVVYERSGESKLALDYFNRALGIFRDIENKAGEAMMLYRVASVQKKLGQIDEARRHITAALEIVETIRGKIASTDLRSSYFATVQEYYELYIELLMRAHRERPQENFHFMALQASEQARARSLLDLLHEARADVRQGVDSALLAREKELLELINGKAAQQQLAFSDPKKAELAQSLGTEIKRLSEEYETLQAGIRQRNPHYADLSRARPMKLADLQNLLDAHTVLLEYKLGDERSYLWLVSQSKIESLELPPRPEVESLARQFYDSLTERNRFFKSETPSQRQSRVQVSEQKLQSVSARLRQMLLGPLGPSIDGKRLVVVADGALQYVPFSVLAGADASGLNGNTSASGAIEVLSLPSISVLAQLRREKSARPTPPRAIAIFADPVFESDDPRLPVAVRRQVARLDHALVQSQSDFEFGPDGTRLPRLFASREEAKAIAALAPAGTSYAALDFQANREQALKSDLNQYRVLHFATHGLLNTSRPQFSGIVLSLYDEKGRERDGFLRLNQIYNLRLSSELVVLSACSTALGKDVRGEGLIGLTRGFMYAGAPRVIASLWKVDDEATTELMKLFYRNLLQKHLPASAALSAAQAEMRAQPRWRSPYYWAAFTLQGDWR
ncbi:MAG: CHAT domain-containing protein, partial [Pyrinomonadaceae bacterium]